ncbi:MAG TPA: hypothetical protein VKA46_37180 [Gemmataceae bacterium]|nr:hypothetical protein [Gemmataceae bacterium]
MKRPFNLPVWVFVNQKARADSPCCVLLLGGSHPPHAPFPATLPVFSTKELAMESHFTDPFVPTEVDKDTFRDMLKNNRSIEDVVLDLGNENATKYRVEELLAQLESA